jgi:hypothetical protein
MEVVDQCGPPRRCVPGEVGVQAASGEVLVCPGCGCLLPVVVPRRGDGFPRPIQRGGGVHLLFRGSGEQRVRVRGGGGVVDRLDRRTGPPVHHGADD